MTSNCSLEGAVGYSGCPEANTTGCLYLFQNCTSTGNITDTEQQNMEPDILYQNFLNQSRFWVQRVLVPSIMAIGIVGNVITIVIMTRRRMRSSTNNYLAALAIFDMMYLIFTFILSLSHYPNANNVEYYFYWKLKPFIIMLTDACSNTSVWLTVTFTVERYIAVCHPMKGKVLCTESRAKKAIVFVFLFCITFTLPTPFEWVIYQAFDDRTNKSTVVMAESELGKDHLYITIYYWLTVVLFIFIPFLLLAIFNSFLIRSVHLSKMTRKTMTRCNESRDHSRQENKITIMLIAVVILFFTCQLPTACHMLYASFNTDLNPNASAILYGLGNIFNFLMAINAAGNFVLYCLLSQKYRRTFLQIFCPCLKGKISRLHSMYQNTVCSNVDNESPGLSRKMSTRSTYLLSSSPRGSTAGVPLSRRGSPVSKGNFLQLPKENSMPHQRSVSLPSIAQKDDHEDTDSEDALKKDCTACRNALRQPWKRLKRTVKKKDARDQMIPLRGGSKCIVITSPDGLKTSASSTWNNAGV